MTGWRDHVSSHGLQYQPKFALQHRHQPTPLHDHSSKHTNLTSNEAFFQPFRRWCCRVALRAPIALVLSRSTSLYFTFDRLELDDISVSTLHALHFVRFLYRYHSNSCTSSALQDFEALCLLPNTTLNEADFLFCWWSLPVASLSISRYIVILFIHSHCLIFEQDVWRSLWKDTTRELEYIYIS